jgi:DNA-binding transcriptional LysR family regulator
MQIESLKVLCDLVETESFTTAAQINGLTQSGVSQQISSLEELFKSLLIERSKKQFRLTPEGQNVYDYSKKIIQSFESLRAEIEEIQQVVSGSIRLSTIYSIGLHDLTPYLKKFLKEYPLVNVRVEYRRSNEVYTDVLTNVADVGLVAFPQKMANLEIIPLHEYTMALICHPEHLLASRKTLMLRDLEGQKFVSFEKDMPTRKAIDRIFHVQGVGVRHTVEFGNVETVKRAVELDMGVAIVPQSTVAMEVAQKTLVALKFSDVNISRPWALIHKKTKVLSPAIKQFIATLKAEPPV